jgi:hypothetical protein
MYPVVINVASYDTPLESQMKTRLILVIAVSFVFVPAISPADPQYPMHISIVQLIATPERFDGQLVSVTGFLHVDRESALLFLTQSDREHAIAENAISFHLNEQMGKDIKTLNVYVKWNSSGLGLLADVSHIRAWSCARHSRREDL